MRSLTIATTALSLFFAPLHAIAIRPPKQPAAGELLRDIDRLMTVGTVLYIAAHPDDENTRLLAYLVNEKHVRAAYLSITRGDGGQNLIGSEQGPMLGLIRTQELLAARAIDGAEQFFTRARDFGYSKTAQETLQIWGKDEVLADVVWVIRSLKPDVILTRFSPNDTDTHGQHTAASLLAVEAFHAAADPKFHPEQLKYVAPWQPRRLFWNNGRWNAKPGDDTSRLLKLDVGVYNPLLGMAYREMAAQSVSMHKSQGFGALAGRGGVVEYFQHLEGDAAHQSIFDGIDFTWNRVPAGKRLNELLQKARQQFKPDAPHIVVPTLLEAEAELAAMPANPWKEYKRQQLFDVILACAGVLAEVTAADFSVAPGNEIKVKALAVNRSPAQIALREIRFSDGSVAKVDKPLANNEPFQLDQSLSVAKNAEFSNPYWLAQPPQPGLYRVANPTLIGLPEQATSLNAEFVFTSGNRSLSVVRPVLFKWTDPVVGERFRPMEIVPAVTVTPSATVLMFPDRNAKELRLVLKSGIGQTHGVLRPEVPAGWSVDPSSLPFRLEKKGAEQEVSIRIVPAPAKLSEAQGGSSGATLRLVAEVDGQKLSRSFVQIDHPHIPIQTLFPESEVKLVHVDLKKRKLELGYIPGPGDEVAAALRQVGYQVTILNDEALSKEPLSQYDAIIVGVRAYNTNERLPFYHKKLMDYVAAGGTLVTQYNTSNFVSRAPAEMGPYSFEISRDRVTDETAAVTFEIPNHQVLRVPNKLTSADFEGWVQERGLYFAGKWDPHYEVPLSMHDPGESPKKGSLLVTRFGKGAFVYTGLAFFRQLPAGVPGAYRLLANLIAYGK